MSHPTACTKLAMYGIAQAMQEQLCFVSWVAKQTQHDTNCRNACMEYGVKKIS